MRACKSGTGKATYVMKSNMRNGAPESLRALEHEYLGMNNSFINEFEAINKGMI